jgi:hypothetical protein
MKSDPNFAIYPIHLFFINTTRFFNLSKVMVLHLIKTEAFANFYYKLLISVRKFIFLLFFELSMQYLISFDLNMA